MEEEKKSELRDELFYNQKNGYDLILDSAAAIFHSKDLDVTDAVLTEMGVDPKAAREKMKNEGK